MSKLFTNTRLRISSACRLYIYVASKLTTSQLRALRTENRREPVVVSSKPVRACIATTEQQLEAVVVGKIVANTTVAGVRLIVTAPEPSERQRAMPPRRHLRAHDVVVNPDQPGTSGAVEALSDGDVVLPIATNEIRMIAETDINCRNDGR